MWASRSSLERYLRLITSVVIVLSLVAGAVGLVPVFAAARRREVQSFACRDITRPRWILLAHFFNHQTHHRGQVHCMITQCGIKPGDTDLPYLPAT